MGKKKMKMKQSGKIKPSGDGSEKKRSHHSKEAPEFLPLEGGPGSRLPKEDEEPPALDSRVVYVGHIPHGFYEEQMQGFFKQFGTIKRLRVARNRKTGKSKHYGFIEFELPEVAKIVADCMNNYLLFEHILQVHTIPPEKIHPKMWKQVKRSYDPSRGRRIERMRHNKDRTGEEHKKMVAAIMRRDLKRRKNIKAAGIDYECPDLIGSIQPTPKKIKFSEEE
ncbi:MKI67 FHA domain-interacting nucleolar phosphoprotein [Nymphaea thermarum]|nr:MKI67 FHA domain-interacting nucleolar phosphoprotein [Nymphaea thermarum]